MKNKQLSNPISTGGLGVHFENHVQTSFAVLMLAGGVFPCLNTWPIVKIKLQGKYQGFETDDLIVYTEHPETEKQAKLLGQIKHTVSVTRTNQQFGEVIQAAWSDFNNKKIFNEGIDIIALICGPLSATDTNDVRQLLKQARSSENSEEFINRIERVRFTSEKQREKLKVFKYQLKSVNNDVEVGDDVLWRFLKSFHLLIYDLDIKGVTLSLLYTLIESYSRNNADAVWCQIKDHVERENENAGFITLASIPEEISDLFKVKELETMPKEFVKDTSEIINIDWAKSSYASEIAIVSLIGSWDENNEEDKAIVSKLADSDYSIWIRKLREILQEQDSPLTLKNGIWKVKNRKELWVSCGSVIFDEYLDRFKECAVSILTELDPKFELPEDKRFAANIYGKVKKHSSFIRKGITEGLALLGACSNVLVNCSQYKAETIALLSIREIFEEADWVLWASLNDLLSLLAESAPNEFLDVVERDLKKTPCPFSEIFNQEGSDSFLGGHYYTGLLWALETLAWDEKLFIRVVTLLGELAYIDPGGKLSNRPSRSLITIFLPWYPQTMASIEKRKVAIQTLNKERSEVAWKLLVSLLPDHFRSSSGSSKPTYRNYIPEGYTGKVTEGEYWEQISFYADFLVELAKDNISKLNKIINNLNNLPEPVFDKFLSYLSAESIVEESEEKRLELWNQLKKIISKHERFSDAWWVLDSTKISKIKKVAIKFEPKKPIYLYSCLFNSRNIDLYEERGDYSSQDQKIAKQRQDAVEQILEDGGIDNVFKLVEIVEFPAFVGFSLGSIERYSFDDNILPELLITNDKKMDDFVSNYIWGRYLKLGWEWIDSFEIKDWTKQQKIRWFIYLPCSKETWDRVSKISLDIEKEYWRIANINPYNPKIDLDLAIDKLIKFNRPYAALECVYQLIFDKKMIDNNKIVQVFKMAISLPELKCTIDSYEIVEIIKYLQDSNTINIEDLMGIEWAYLPFLDGYRGVKPKVLERQLATDPKFFCETISLIYRSNKESKEKQRPKEVNESVWDLIHNWDKPPGLQEDGSFDENNFKSWLEEVKKICIESGHLDIALQQVGKVLFYSPADLDGFWINRVVADALNDKDAEEIRTGFGLEIYNSRGVHMIDPTGKPEKELAQKYRDKAEETENAGYHRFARTLRQVVESYDREAERNIEREWFK